MRGIRRTAYRALLALVLVAMLAIIAAVCAYPVWAETAPGAAPAPAAGIDLTAIINAAIALIGAVLTYKVIPYLKERMTDAQYQRTAAMVNVAVYAAEEIYRGGQGDKKLKYAQEYLRRHGYDVDAERIKAAVRAMRNAEPVGVIVNNFDGTQGPEVDDWDEDTEEPDDPDNPAKG